MDNRRERKKQRTRAALLEAATGLFADRGIYGTRVEDITERADLGKGAFYNYFPSKDALVAELVAKGVDTFRSEYLSQMNGTEAVADRVEELARLHAEFLDEYPQFSLLFHQARGLLSLKETRVEKLREVFATYLRGVGHAILPKGEADACDDDTLLDIAAALLGSVSGYRSFRVAAALPLGQSTAREVLTLGIPEVLEQRLEAGSSVH